MRPTNATPYRACSSPRFSWQTVTFGKALPMTGMPLVQVPSVLQSGFALPWPVHVSTPLKELFNSCFHLSPLVRPTFG